MDLFWLDDAQWQAIAAHLPSKQTGPKRSDDRVVISGIIHVLLSGCAWRDCPREYGPYMTVFNRFNRWKNRGIWDRIVTTLTANSNLRPLLTRDGVKLGAAVVARTRSAPHTRLAGTSPATEGLIGAGATPAGRAPGRAWDEAATQLRELAHAHSGKPITAWIDAVIEWHMDSLFARLDWSPGLASEAHSYTDDAQERFNPRQIKFIADRFNAEIDELRLKLLEAVNSVQSYTDDPIRNGQRAKMQLGKLQDELSKTIDLGRRAKAS